MKIRSTLIKPFATLISRKIQRDSANALEDQSRIFTDLVSEGSKTSFGKDHGFSSVKSYNDFKDSLQIQDYEDLRSYIDRIRRGEKNVLWPGLPSYFAKTSGTTSGAKYIPMTKQSTPHHVTSARNAVLNYSHETKNYDVFDGKMIFLSGSPELDRSGVVPTGRLSGIVNHQVPAWLKVNQLPSPETNRIEDWETKLSRIVDETVNQDMRLISGIPPWVEMYFERLLARTGKETVVEIFPNFSVFVYGGVNYEPYRPKIEKLIGKPIDSIETFPASEGFFGYQVSQKEESLLLNTNVGIFYEFIRLDDFMQDKYDRISLVDVELDVDYVLIVTTNAGLWAYNVGDTVRFVSKNPFKILVTGRVKHYISAFGEHVIGKEVDEAIRNASEKSGMTITEYTVAPQVSPPDGGTPYHEWFVEADEIPADKKKEFEEALDQSLVEQNIYYKDLRDGNILRTAQVTYLPPGSFQQYMKEQGKLGGQNKVPRLMNNRQIADQLKA